jgi:tetratricopeptide (TPR) repeat protein
MKSRTRKRLIALGLVLVICAGGAIALRQIRSVRRAASIEQAREAGMAAYDAGDWHAALDRLGSYVRRSGEPDAEALYRLADARLRIPEPDNSHLTLALRSAIDAEAADPDNAEARRLLLDLYIRRNQFIEALETLDRALEAQPRDRELLEMRVEILAGLGRWPEAREAALALAAAFPKDPEVHRGYLGVIAGEGGNRAADQIRAYLDDAAEAMGPGADLEIFRAEALVMLGDSRGALAACRAALEAGPTGGEQVALLLDTIDSLAGFDETRVDALTLMRQGEDAALALSPLPEDVGVALVSRWYRRNADPRVEQALAGAIAAPGQASDTALGWAAVAGNPRAAFAGPVRAELASRQSEEAAFWTAAVAASDAMQEGDVAAIEPAREAVGLSENLDRSRRDERILALYLQAGAEEVRGAAIIAEEGFRTIASQSRWQPARTAYINHLLNRGAFAEALDALNHSAVIDPVFIYTPDGLLLRASALIGLAERDPGARADLADAARILDYFVQNSGERSGLYLGLLARTRAAAGDLDAAALALDQMLLLGEELAIREIVKTGSALRGRAPQLAERLLAEARRRDPGNIDLLFDEAVAAARAGRSGEALQMLDRGIAAAEGDERLRLRLLRAQLLDTEESADDALADLTALASEFPDDLTVQRAVLESRAAWSQEPIIRAAIARVRAISGEESSAWRLAEARRLLSFTPSQQRASEALTVALEPLLRSGGDARAHALAGRAWL